MPKLTNLMLDAFSKLVDAKTLQLSASLFYLKLSYKGYNGLRFFVNMCCVGSGEVVYFNIERELFRIQHPPMMF